MLSTMPKLVKLKLKLPMVAGYSGYAFAMMERVFHPKSWNMAAPVTMVCAECGNGPSKSAASWIFGAEWAPVRRLNAASRLRLRMAPPRAALSSTCSEERGVTRDPSLSVDDHPLLRGGIAALIGNQIDMELIAEACDGREALEQFRKHHPDITLMDLQMPEMSGIDAISAIRAEFPEARIVILTTHAGDVQVSRALKAGARAYLLKGSLRNELLETIRAVHAGQKRVSPEVAAEIAEHSADNALTPREVDVLRLVAKGNANKEIAAQLSLTEETVKSHIRNILAKLEVKDRTHAVAIGAKRGIIDL
jgi:DNA-binding NarL/FixJ family response regulator